MVLTFTILILAWNYYASGQPGRAAVTPALVLGMMSYLTYFASAGFPVAFRGDLDHLDFLKTLPLHPLALTVGELAGCVGVFSTFQILILAIFWAAAPSGGWMLLAAAVLAPPVNWVMLATGNLLFLLYPIRPTSGASTDLNAVGRGCLVLVLQSLILLPLLGIPAGIGGIAYLASGSSAPVMVVAALALLLAEAVPMTMLVARAFERFDPSTEIPA